MKLFSNIWYDIKRFFKRDLNGWNVSLDPKKEIIKIVKQYSNALDSKNNAKDKYKNFQLTLLIESLAMYLCAEDGNAFYTTTEMDPEIGDSRYWHQAYRKEALELLKNGFTNTLDQMNKYKHKKTKAETYEYYAMCMIPGLNKTIAELNKRIKDEREFLKNIEKAREEKYKNIDVIIDK